MIGASVRVASRPLLSLLLLVACDNSPSQRPTVIGDWFACRDDSCSRFDSDGFRFDPKGAILALETDDDLISADAPFCVTLGKESGTYAFDGKLLVVRQGGNLQQFETDLVGNSMVLVPVTGEGRRVEVRRFETRVAPSCRDSDGPSSGDPPRANPSGMPTSGSPLKPSPPDGDGPIIDGHLGPRADAGSALLPDAGERPDAGSMVLPDGGTRPDTGAADSSFPERDEPDAAASDAGVLL